MLGGGGGICIGYGKSMVGTHVLNIDKDVWEMGKEKYCRGRVEKEKCYIPLCQIVV